jgi:chlorobactene lauroyltransferase
VPPAPPTRFAAQGFARYLRGLFQQQFAAAHLGPARLAASAAPVGPLLFVANHSNWWDGFLAYLVGARLGLHFHILMEAVNLDRYWMFKFIGALPMRRDSAPAAYEDLTRAGRHLRRPLTGLWVFPQGTRSSPDAPIRETERGAAHLALALGQPVTIWPVAFRYRYLGEQLPEAFAWLGEPWVVGDAARSSEVDHSTMKRARRELALEIERRLQTTVDQLDQRLALESVGEFDILIPGRLSINKRLDRVRHALGFLRGPFERRNG